MRTDEPTPTLVWVDTETTGLNPLTDRLLEVAAIVTDVDLNELPVPRFHGVVGWDGDITAGVHELVAEMHEQNGLWAACRESEERLADVDERFAGWLRLVTETAGAERLTIAGATPTFDVGFLAVQMPVSHGLLHYRLFDVSTLRQAALWWHADTLGADALPDEAEHRAVSDIEGALTLARNMRWSMLAGMAYDGNADS